MVRWKGIKGLQFETYLGTQYSFLIFIFLLFAALIELTKFIPSLKYLTIFMAKEASGC